MTNFDYAMQKPSSLDIANSARPIAEAPLRRSQERPPKAAYRIDGTQSRALMAHMATQDIISNKLREAFSPDSLQVVNESHLHEGHAGHRPGGETHFRVYIVSPAFKGKSRLERHRMINALLEAELSGGVHALAIHAQAPGEG
jgi:BolA family transcriptional regulator, general stress-responsive regulator